MNVYEIESVSITALDHEKAVKTMQTGCEILEKIGVKYWLSAGTLLGLHRNKGFIPHDTDIDVEVLGDERVDEIFEKLPFKPIRIQEHNGHYSQIAFIDENDVIFDIYFFYEHGDRLINYNEHGILFYTAEMFRQLTTINFSNHAYACPDPDQYCEFRYGKSWRIPKSSKDAWSEDASNLVLIGNYQKSREFLEKLLDQDNDENLILLLGDIACINNDVEFALECYEAVSENKTLVELATVKRSELLLKTSQAVNAVKLLDDYLKDHSDSIRVQNALYAILSQGENPEKALEYFEKLSQYLVNFLPEEYRRKAGILPELISEKPAAYVPVFSRVVDAVLQNKRLANLTLVYVLRQILTGFSKTSSPEDISTISKIHQWAWRYLQFCEFRDKNIFFGAGFYQSENGSCWMKTSGEIIIKASSEPAYLVFDMSCNAGEYYNKFPFTVRINSNGRTSEIFSFNNSRRSNLFYCKIDESDQDMVIKLESDASFIPCRIGLNSDTRRLSIKLHNVVFTRNYNTYKTLTYYAEQFQKTAEDLLEKSSKVTSIESDLEFLNNEISLIDEELKNNKKKLYEYEALTEGQNTYIDYEKWVKQNALSADDKEAIIKECAAFEQRPKISILTPVYNVDPEWLYKCVDSVRAQLYDNWDLLLVDDGSSNPDTVKALKELENIDQRVIVKYRDKNGGISAATNTALFNSSGSYIALLDNDDEITVDALYEVVKLINQYPAADYIYSDEDKLDSEGKRCEPFFKPDWSPELIRSYAYTNHFSVYRAEFMKRLNGLHSEFDGAQDYDLVLRAAAKTKNIYHIPKVLYHWRKIAGSAADVVDAKSYALNRAQTALKEHVKSTDVYSAPGAPGCFRVRYKIKGNPLVSILIPIRGQKTEDHQENLLYQCIRSVVNLTDYTNYEILVGYNNEIDPEIAEFCERYSVKLLNYPLEGEFNFAKKINYMARHSTGEHLVIFNDDLEVVNGDWLTALLELSQQEDIGAVGSKLLYPDGRLQHVGVIMGINGYPAHVFHQARPSHPGYYAHANLIRNYAAVTGAGMMVSRKLFEQFNGFDEQYPTDYNDTDFCLRLMENGYRNVYTPYSLFKHHESAVITGNRLNWQDTANFRQRWNSVLANDPYYNPNLTKKHLNYRINITEAR